MKTVVHFTILVLATATQFYNPIQSKTQTQAKLIAKENKVLVQRQVTNRVDKKTRKNEALVRLIRKYFTKQEYINRERVLKYLKRYYTKNEIIAFDNLVKTEGHYDPSARNKSGACGLPQALPCSRMDCPLDQSGLICQVEWMRKYIQKRYGNPVRAWNYKVKMGWY